MAANLPEIRAVARTSRVGGRHAREFGTICARVAVLAFVALAPWCVTGCRSTPAHVFAPIPAEATDLVFAADDAMRARPPRLDDARVALARARELAPDWVAPRRLEDELARGDLFGVEALRAHRAELARDPRDAGVLYLAGRLEGALGVPRFEAAVAAAPDLSFAHHGLAYAAGAYGHVGDAVTEARRALATARDPWERTFFTLALARHLSFSALSEALALLDARATQPEVRPSEHAALVALSIQLALGSASRQLQRQAYERGLEALRCEELCDADVEEIVSRMRGTFSADDAFGWRLSLALSAKSSPTRERLRAEKLLDDASTPLAHRLYERALERLRREPPVGALVRTGRFATMAFADAVERWRRELPAVVLNADGLPRNPVLARVVRAARGLDAANGANASRESALAIDGETIADSGSANSSAIVAPSVQAIALPSAGADASRVEAARSSPLGELGEALIAAGWFREARSVAIALCQVDLDAGLALENRALAGVEVLEGVRRVLRRIDEAVEGDAAGARKVRNERDDPRPAPGAPTLQRASPPIPSILGGAEDTPPPRTLDGLLDAFASTFALAGEFLPGGRPVDALRDELRASPRIDYAGVAEVVHPGPVFSDEDQVDGRGTSGDDVGGLARRFASIGRFALCGRLAGDVPDATVLPILSFEERSGTYLGVPWHGSVAWCEAADVKSRAGRRGASISAAALHEGFWVDVDSVREELGAWNALRRRFADTGARERVAALLSSPGLALEDPRSISERVSIAALLSESQRVRLAVLRDRAAGNAAMRDRAAGSDGANGAAGDDSVLGRVTLDELLEVTAAHEEGHLCDRTRFLPVSKHKLACLGLLIQCGLRPQRVAEELEYRAQLTCIAVSQDPRIPLAQVLDLAEGGASGITPHAAGYERLLSDLLRVMVESKAPTEGIDPAYTYAHQLHRVPPEAIRSLARALAREKGMIP